MKLAPAQAEAVHALSVLYRHAPEPDVLAKLETVLEYAVTVFADESRGGWFGYASREGRVTHRVKGTPEIAFGDIAAPLYEAEALLFEAYEDAAAAEGSRDIDNAGDLSDLEESGDGGTPSDHHHKHQPSTPMQGNAPDATTPDVFQAQDPISRAQARSSASLQ